MNDLTFFQRLELILIPITFLFSLLIIFLIGFNILGTDIWNILGVPVICGSILGIISVYFSKNWISFHSFEQLEKLFRIIVLSGAIVLIPLLFGQIIGLLSSNSIFSIIALIFAAIGTTMGITCFLALNYRNSTRKLSK